MIDELHLDTAVIFQDRIILPLPWNLNLVLETPSDGELTVIHRGVCLNKPK